MFDLMNQLARHLEVQSPSYPALNLWEDGDRFVLEAELPGVKPEGLELSVVDNQLTLKAARPADPSESGVFLRRERPCGAFVRTVPLPSGVDPEAVEASLSHGILTVTLPKAEAAKPRRIPVKTA